MVAGAIQLWHAMVIGGLSITILFGLSCAFTATLIAICQRIRLYVPRGLSSILRRQRLSLLPCSTSGAVLASSLYLIHASYIPRSVVLIAVGLVTITFSLGRLVHRMIACRSLERSVDTGNAVIVDAAPGPSALRRPPESVRRLGSAFKKFIDSASLGCRSTDGGGDVAARFDTLFRRARKQFAEPFFLTSPYENRIVKEVLEPAGAYGMELRLAPGLHQGGAWDNPIEYMGRFPAALPQRRTLPEVPLLVKRGIDMLVSSLTLILLLPLFLAIAIAIKLDSTGPVLYFSERLGKKGRVFRCFKFRSMICDAEKHRAEIMHLNERDGVLFKISNDPRITRVGRILRRYSIDELPQFFNVLRGDMSVVGPRPALASEVRSYKAAHLRRFDVIPGITGLWQVQARQDPSFDSYISLDMSYIDNWSIWLDLKIILRTISVVLSGTGS